ncbi:MAG: transglycosylase SLT domain-containing protein [Nitrospinaceae bacterium]|nr:transglycosylase SLT domain-containing protein [Nitrospinaceae bacterium]MBT5948265.1 transglycosylase SLT domain-containing protein [Nitrospinaceae bacterium]
MGEAPVRSAATPPRQNMPKRHVVVAKENKPTPASKEKSLTKKPAEEPTKKIGSPHDLILDLPATSEDEEHTAALKPIRKTGEIPTKPFTFDIPIVRNTAVDRWIEYFTGSGRANFAIWLSRGGRYIKTFREIFKDNNLPQDLAYLSLIESGFSLRARSRAGAVGPWQFMPATARRSGLKVNRYVDERRHPIKATHAAVYLLTALYKEFGHWDLALAAYNSGENRIRRARKRSGRKTFWALTRTRYIPNETKNYVPKFLAGLIIAKNPEVFGFSGIDYQKPRRWETVALPRGMSLKSIARMAGAPLKSIQDLNSELRWRYTPPVKGHLLRLPSGTANRFLEILAKTPREPIPVSGHYRILPGDTFGLLAKRFGISLHKMLELNAHLNPRRLRVGTPIFLPQKKTSIRTSILTSRNGGMKKPPKAKAHHVVGPGENLWVIARQYGVSTNQLLRLNGLKPSTKIHPGNRIIIHR